MDKAATGIRGFDDITRGGLPRGRVTLIDGAAGSGKTVLALQTLVNGATKFGEPGIFVAFEENSRRIIENAQTFGWGSEASQTKDLVFIDAQPDPAMLQSGKFDLEGMLSVVGAKAQALGAKRIVFDALDIVLTLMDDLPSMRRETYRLHDWLLQKNLTAIVTAKSGGVETGGSNSILLDFMQFMVDVSVHIGHDIVGGISQRNIRVCKYRGSQFEENITPITIGADGIETAYSNGYEFFDTGVTTERLSSGVERLDRMLDGGYYRGASILLTGAPGTAKTTLCGTFLEAACTRGEKSLFISFDSPSPEIVRNLRSVGIDLDKHVKSGVLKMVSDRAIEGSAEIHLLQIKQLAEAHKARCVVVDPLSALSKAGNIGTSASVAERLIDWAKVSGITLLSTSLLDQANPQLEGTPLQISTLSDTWINLSYVTHAGERNRSLSIIKSRGTRHSNQVRELLLGKNGPTLTDVYVSGGEVLMGTLRWQKEREDRLKREERLAAADRQQHALDIELAELQARKRLIEVELDLKAAEKDAIVNSTSALREEFSDLLETMRAMRGADDLPL